MIIECQACRARFKLDESRIKGKGARIRCRKCGETIIVMKSDIPPAKPSPPVGKELFDLRAVLREPEPKRPVPPREEVDAAFDSILPQERETEQGPSPVEGVPPPPVEREQEPFAPEPGESHAEPATAPRDEVDTAFDRLLHGDRERETEEPVPSPDAGEPGPAPRDEVDAAFESPLFPEGGIEESPPSVAEEPGPGKEIPDALFSLELEREEKLSFLEETGDIPSRGPQDKADEEMFIPHPPAEEGSEPGEFLIIDTDSSDYLRKEESAAESTRPFDISEHLRQAPAGTPEGDTLPVPPSPGPTMRTAEPPSSRAEAIQDQLAGLAGSGRMEETSVPEPPPMDIPPPRLLEIGKPPAARPRTTAPAGRPSIMLLVLLFVTLAGGGAYLAFTTSGQETLRTVVSAMESFWLGGKEPARPYKVENLFGYYEKGENAGQLFVVKGVVTNPGRTKKSGIRIRAELLDGNHQTIAEKTVYAGNVIPGLGSMGREAIEAAMANRFGDRLSNVDVAQGKSVPFMVVFFDPPGGIEEYRLEALGGE
jgi:predicted Zn finger-like uncharacterized protein